LLGDCGVTLFAAPKLAAKYRRRFPRALDGAPFLLPGEGSTLRSAVDQWLEKHRILPRVVGEFDDSALIKVFGQAGGGIFAAPSRTQAPAPQMLAGLGGSGSPRSSGYCWRPLSGLSGPRQRSPASCG